MHGGQAALDLLDREEVDAVLIDPDLPRVSGLNVLAALPSVDTDASVIAVSSPGGVEPAVEAMKAGAPLAFGIDHENYDYAVDPVATETAAALGADLA